MLGSRLVDARTRSGADGKDNVRALRVLCAGQLLGRCGVGEVADKGGTDDDVRVYILRAFNVANKEVADGGGLLASNKADYAGFGGQRSQSTAKEGTFILHCRKGGTVRESTIAVIQFGIINDKLLLRELRSHFHNGFLQAEGAGDNDIPLAQLGQFGQRGDRGGGVALQLDALDVADAVGVLFLGDLHAGPDHVGECLVTQ